MLTSTLGVIMIAVGAITALAALEGLVMYAAQHPTWKHPGTTAGAGEVPAEDGLVPPGREDVINGRDSARPLVGSAHRD